MNKLVTLEFHLNFDSNSQNKIFKNSLFWCFILEASLKIFYVKLTLSRSVLLNTSVCMNGFLTTGSISEFSRNIFDEVAVRLLLLLIIKFWSLFKSSLGFTRFIFYSNFSIGWKFLSVKLLLLIFLKLLFTNPRF